MRIREFDCCSQSQLGRLSGMDVATIKGVVDRLRRKEAKTDTDPNDKQRSLISPMPKGTMLITGLQKFGHKTTEKTLSPLSETERQVLFQALRKVS